MANPVYNPYYQQALPQFNQPIQQPQYDPYIVQGYPQQLQTNSNRTAPMQNFVKCRAVTSIDEAKAAMIDLDGSVHVFTDLNHNCIYTKQITLDGSAAFNIYKLDNPEDNKKKSQSNEPMFVEREELGRIIGDFDAKIADLSTKIDENDNYIRDYTKRFDTALKRVEKGGTR